MRPEWTVTLTRGNETKQILDSALRAEILALVEQREAEKVASVRAALSAMGAAAPSPSSKRVARTPEAWAQDIMMVLDSVPGRLDRADYEPNEAKFIVEVVTMWAANLDSAATAEYIRELRQIYAKLHAWLLGMGGGTLNVRGTICSKRQALTWEIIGPPGSCCPPERPFKPSEMAAPTGGRGALFEWWSTP